MIGNYNDDTNFPHTLLLTDTQVSKICIAFANGLSTDIKFSKTQLFKMVKSGGFSTDISGIASALDNCVNFPFKMGNSYLKELSNMSTKKT